MSFQCPGGWKLKIEARNSTPRALVEPLCRTLSQIIVSRDQNLIIILCKMSICENSLLISFNSRIIRVYFIRFQQGQVWSCDNSLAKTFIFGFLELSYFSFLYHLIVIICPEAQGRFVKPLQGILQNRRPPEAAWHALLSMIFRYRNVIIIEP